MRFKRNRPSGNGTTTITNKKALENDRISALPDVLLVSILYILTTKESIKTCTLSKRWQHLWKSVPAVLDLCPGDRMPMLGNNLLPNDCIQALHKSPKLAKFRLCCLYDERYSWKVDSWLRFAMTMNVEKLNLLMYPILYLREEAENAFYLLPECVYDNPSMLILKLGYCLMLPPRNPINWQSLNILSLSNMQLSDCLIRDISSGCPSLTILGLRLCGGYYHMDINSKRLSLLIIFDYLASSSDSMEGSALEICAPNIRSLVLMGSFPKQIRVINLSSLVDAKLFILYYPNVLDELLQSLKHVQNLTVPSQDIQSEGKCQTLNTNLIKWDFPESSLFKNAADLDTLFSI